jgi:hypothetical protein
MINVIAILIVLFIVLAPVLAIVFGILVFNSVSKTKNNYVSCLQRLKKDPNNPDLRQKALYYGRRLSKLTRNSSSRHRFDEVALMNDINAACANATVGLNQVAKVEVKNQTSGNSVAQEIEKLSKLLIAGVISGEEFERGKALFLGTPPDRASSAIELLQNLDDLRKKGVLSESEFNTKKWEILSERLLPKTSSGIPSNQTKAVSHPPAPSSNQTMIACPQCSAPLSIPDCPSILRFACPQCSQTIELE